MRVLPFNSYRKLGRTALDDIVRARLAESCDSRIILDGSQSILMPNEKLTPPGRGTLHGAGSKCALGFCPEVGLLGNNLAELVKHQIEHSDCRKKGVAHMNIGRNASANTHAILKGATMREISTH